LRVSASCLQYRIFLGNTLEYNVTTESRIPQTADSYIKSLPLTVLGYGWVDFDTLTSDGVVTGVFATIHPAFTDSTYSQGRFWHAHTGLVAPSETAENTLCLVYLASPQFDLKNVNNTITQTLSSADATVSSADVDDATAFTLQINEDACPAIEVPVLSEQLGTFLPIEVILLP
jgi:hypothetical protein